MKKVGVVFLALLVGLGLAAATYAYWSDSLSISGTVSTGNLDVQFADSSASDNEDAYDVASVTCEILDEKTAKITVDNAYPGYEATCSFDVENTGTIPAKIKDTSVNNPNTEISVDYSWSGLDANNVLAVGGTATLDVVTTVTEDAAEDSTYTYTISIDVGQFNE